MSCASVSVKHNLVGLVWAMVSQISHSRLTSFPRALPQVAGQVRADYNVMLWPLNGTGTGPLSVFVDEFVRVNQHTRAPRHRSNVISFFFCLVPV